jgi:hypothetical protein
MLILDLLPRHWVWFSLVRCSVLTVTVKTAAFRDVTPCIRLVQEYRYFNFEDGGNTIVRNVDTVIPEDAA